MSIADLQLGRLAQLADSCSDAKQKADTFERLSHKSNKKASTRAAAASNSAYWRQVAASVCVPQVAIPAPQPPPPNVPSVGVTPPPQTSIHPPPQTGGPYPAYTIPPQSYDTSGIHAGPYVSSSIPADVLAAITGASPLPVGAGASTPAAGPTEFEECSQEYQAALPLVYSDAWGPMQVVQIRCVG